MAKRKLAEPPKDKNGELAADWKLQIELAERRNEKWEKRCERIVKRYRDERPDVDGVGSNGQRRMNIFWSNVQTLKPSIYGREPVPIAERRFLDRDVVGRVASQILERAMRYEMGDCGFHESTEQAILDYLTVGRGVAWLRYKPIEGPASSLADRGDDQLSDRAGEPVGESDDGPAPDAERDDEELGPDQTREEPRNKLLSASLEVDYVPWKDFLHSKARFWKENEWVARRHYMSRKDLIDSFGKKTGEDIPLEMTPEDDANGRSHSGRAPDSMPDSMKKAIVYEIWFKPERKVYFIAKGYDKLCEEPREDPLNLEGFWPCPRPLFATMTNDTLEPVPDYLEYQDQALEIDDLTNRIGLLIKALKVAGVYNAANKGIARIFDEGHENQLIPVVDWAAFVGTGAMDGAIQFVPIKEISDVLLALFEARDKIKQDLYEITGIADVIRGQSDPRETATAVATKGRFGSLRLQDRQATVARFCRDLIRMMGEIIAEHFPDETLITVSGALYDEGIGPSMPKPPGEPQPGQQPPQSPMMGHNGGPPMAPPTASAAPPGPPQPNIAPQPPQPPNPALRPNGPAVPAGMAQPVPGSMPPPQSPGHPAMTGGGPMQPPNGAPLPPEIAHAMAMAQYQGQVAAVQAERQRLITAALALLRQDKLRGFRIDIETDSTIENDANEDKQNRIAFIEATTKFVEQAFQIGAQAPEAVPMLGKMLLFGVRGFRAGRDLESTIEEFVDQAEKDAKAKQGQPKPPDPKVQAEQVQAQAEQAKAQAEIAKAKIDAESSAQDNQRQMAAKELDMRLKQQQAQSDNEQMAREAQYKEAEFKMRMAELAMQARIAETSHGHAMEQSAAAHQQKMAAAQAGPEGGKATPAKPARPKPKAAGPAIAATPEIMAQMTPPIRHPDGGTYVQHRGTGQHFAVNAGA